MDADGTHPLQLSGTPGTSDHDPTPSGSIVLFERFLKGTDYSTDFSAFFTPWNLIEAPLNGSGERTVLADGWINWLPIYDPGHHYIAHLKTVGYTDVRLLNPKGRDLGRLIPGHTKVRYLDWK